MRKTHFFSTEGAFKFFFYQGYLPLEMSALCDMPLSAPGLLSHGGGGPMSLIMRRIIPNTEARDEMPAFLGK